MKILDILARMAELRKLVAEDPRDSGFNMAQAAHVLRRGQAAEELAACRQALGAEVLARAGWILLQGVAQGKVNKFVAVAESISKVPPVDVSAAVLYSELATRVDSVDKTSGYFSAYHFQELARSLQDWCETRRIFDFQMIQPDGLDSPLPHSAAERHARLTALCARLVRKANGDVLTWEAIRGKIREWTEVAFDDLEEEPTTVPVILSQPQWLTENACNVFDTSPTDGRPRAVIGPDELPARDKINQSVVQGYLDQINK